MDIVPIMQQLNQLRVDRLHVVEDNLDPNDPNVVNNLIADAINSLENLYLIINISRQPQDGFFPFTPKKEGDN